ncbi:ATPase [Plantactinospora sp. GCM10030261]|uniref:ATPase n=1 Tax=Plantactinospora sp. GCM10030261 TaxID=3273420 RepID=UPI003620035B
MEPSPAAEPGRAWAEPVEPVRPWTESAERGRLRSESPEPGRARPEPAGPVRPWAEPAERGRVRAEPAEQSRPWTEPAEQSRPWTEPAEQGRPWTEPAEQGRPWTEPAEQGRPWTEPAERGRVRPEPAPPPLGAAGRATPPPGAAGRASPGGFASAPVVGSGPAGTARVPAARATVAPVTGAAPVVPPGPVQTGPAGTAAVRPASGRATPGAGYQRPAVPRPGRTDDETERSINVLGREIDRPRVLAFANPKGGVHKTTATVLAAASIGSVRGRGVLAWDDNELRGTLGLRAGSARHARTIRHLIADLMLIEASQGPELTERLDDYLRHAADGSYDVLAGEENSRFAHRLDQHTVRRVLDLLRRTHNVICVDTGNNVESPNWQTVLRAADQLVVTTVPREDAAFTADWMLDHLHEVGMGELADNAVTLLSCPTPGRSPLLDDLRRHFLTRTRAVAVVPYDPALETGSSIEYAQLQADTRDAWLQAAAVMVEPFVR